MTTSVPPLANWLRDRLASGEGADAIFDAAEAAGHDVSALLDLLDELPRYFPREDSWAIEEGLDFAFGMEPIHALVEHYGLARAQEVMAGSVRFRGVDAQAVLADLEASARAGAALAQGAPIAETYALIAHPAIALWRREHLLALMAHRYAIHELASTHDQWSEVDLESVRRVLGKRTSALAALEALLSIVDDATIVRFISRIYEVTCDDTKLDSSMALVAIYARLSRLALRSLAPVMRLAAAGNAPVAWLPILRAEGLKGSLAALHLLEADVPPLDIALELARAGYRDDEVATALLENAVGTARSLALLRAAGWSPERMVEMLHRRGTLLPEVRAHMGELGVTVAALLPMAKAHFDLEVVELVLAEGKMPRALPGSREIDVGAEDDS